MRYEHIELDISTATCAVLLDALQRVEAHSTVQDSQIVRAEYRNLVNELRARLQRTDKDPRCPKNQVSNSQEWLDV